MVTGLDSRKMKLINDCSVSDLDAAMGPSEILDLSFTQYLSHPYLFWSVLDPGPAVLQGPTVFLEAGYGLQKKTLQSPYK